MSQPTPKKNGAAGFGIMEVMVAAFVLTIGILSAAALSATLINGARQSKYLSMASILASEKLEDLNRWDGNDPQVCVPTGSTTEGSLTADSLVASITCPSGSASSNGVNYYDDVTIDITNGSGNCSNPSYGCFAETMSSMSSGSTVYTTTYHSPDGQIITSSPTSTAPAFSTFHRRWLIEANTPVSGTRRVTVIVACNDPTVQPPVSFQMSMVRP